jgi:hypothetical protein
MPELSRFFGIVVTMHYADDAPPHFHARYGEHRAAIALQPLRLLEGHLPPRALGFVMEWAVAHQIELVDDWPLARAGKPLRRIDPLE